MEKFARQAISEGITDVNQLRVTRDSDLFRALNVHYNKNNDWRVSKLSFPFAMVLVCVCVCVRVCVRIL